MMPIAPNGHWTLLPQGLLDVKTIQHFFRVDRKAISLIRFTFEGYEGIATVTTLNASDGIITICIAPGCEPDVAGVLSDLQKQIYIETLPPDDFLKNQTTIHDAF